jgi:hypothetical protein
VLQITYLLRQIGHRECLVKQSELPLLALLVVRVPKDTTVEQRSMYIRYHTPDIPSGVRGFGGRGIFDAVEVVYGGSVEIQRIPLIERVDFAARRDLDIGMGEHELTERSIKCESVDSIARGEDKICGRTIPEGQRSGAGPSHTRPTKSPHCVTGSNHLSARPQDVLNRAFRSWAL